MSLDPLLLDVLACPVDKGPLLWFEDEDVLYNPRLQEELRGGRRRPVMLVDEAVDVGDAEHERLMAKAEKDKVRATGPGRGVSEPGATSTRSGCGRPPPPCPSSSPAALERRRRRCSARGRRPRPRRRRAVVAFGLGTGALAAEAAAAARRPRPAVPFWVGAATRVPGVRRAGHAWCFAVVVSGGDRRDAGRGGASAAARGAGGGVGGDGGRRAGRAGRGRGFPWCPMPAAGRAAAARRSGRRPCRCSCALCRAGPRCRRPPRRRWPRRPRRWRAGATRTLATGGPAAELARRIGRTIPLVYGPRGVAAVAAQWWKACVNLNAKAPAFAAALPAL